jgi:hypothetical protein
MNEDLLKLKKISGKAFRNAKRWYSGYVFWQVGALFFALSTFAFDYGAKVSALITLIVVTVSEVFRWRSDEWKSDGEWAKRKLEAADGLGASVDHEEVENWLVERPRRFLADIRNEEIQGSDFASREEPSPRRAVENIRESAWWSKYLCRRMVFYLLFLLIGIALGGLSIFAYCICKLKSIDFIQNADVVQIVGSVICSVWAFIFSINVLRLIFDYHTFAREAGGIVHRSGLMLKSDGISEREAYDIMHDYQTARCVAPLIPTFIWKLHCKHLNECWTEFCK